MPSPDSPSASSTPALEAVRFAGLRIHPLDVDETVSVLAGRPTAEPFAPYVTPNVEFIFYQSRSPALRRVFEACLVSTNDSRILHRLGKLAGLELKFAPGAYVAARLFEGAIRPDDPLAVIGATPEIVEDLRTRFGLTQVVQHVPPMGFIRDPAAVRAAVDFIAAHPSRFVFVAMGPPQSEALCDAVMQDGRATGVGLCIGSSLQVMTGAIGAAPDWMETGGLVWLHRLAREPGRLWKRYLVHDLYGVAVCLADAARLRLSPSRSRVA